MNFNSYKDGIDFLKAKNNQFSFDESFSLARLCSNLLNEPSTENLGRELIIRVLEIFDKVFESTKVFWEDLVETAGLYPYISSKKILHSSLLRYEYHKSKYLEGVYLHEVQQEVSIALHSGLSVVLSAPTSFGKSLLIEEIIASKKFRNVAIIQPTLALLDETRKKMTKYSDAYNIVVSTSQLPSQNNNIFLFTGERLVEYQHLKKVDFFIIDEFYKLSLDRDDERAVTLNQAFYKLLKLTNHFYLLGPSIKSIPVEFHSKLNISFKKSDFITVAVNEHFMPNLKLKNEERKLELFKLLVSLKDPTLVYCATPDKSANLSLEFTDFIAKNIEKNTLPNSEIIEWLQDNIHPDWSLIKNLKSKIGFHNGSLPRHLGSSLVDSFNSGNIKYLFCTSTLIEGVNTAAKNIILFDNKKGSKYIDYFDFKNIAGRPGRMNKYFTGNVYKFYKDPPQNELDIDIPIFTQNNAPIELLIHLDENELNTTSISKLKRFNNYDIELQEILKSNGNISIEGQMKVIEAIESDLQNLHSKMQWRTFPTFDELFAVIDLGWKFLLKSQESKANVASSKQLTYYTMNYYNTKSISGMINSQLTNQYLIDKFPLLQDRVNAVVLKMLNITRHWFDFKLPKWLTVISKLQEYVFTKNNLRAGDYTAFAASLENAFLPSELSTLIEYDIPQSAIRKLRNEFGSNTPASEILVKIKKIDLDKINLNQYEKDKIKKI